VTTSDDKVLKNVVNVNTVSHEVLACLPGMTESLAYRVVRARADLPQGFESVADLLDVEGFSETEFRQICSHVTVRSDVFRVRSFGVIGDGEVYRCAEAVIDRTEDETHIRLWRELE